MICHVFLIPLSPNFANKTKVPFFSRQVTLILYLNSTDSYIFHMTLLSLRQTHLPSSLSSGHGVFTFGSQQRWFQRLWFGFRRHPLFVRGGQYQPRFFWRHSHRSRQGNINLPTAAFIVDFVFFTLLRKIPDLGLSKWLGSGESFHFWQYVLIVWTNCFSLLCLFLCWVFRSFLHSLLRRKFGRVLFLVC